MEKTISFFLREILILLGSAKSDSLQTVSTQASIKSNSNPEYHKLARDIFNELIEINTTSTYGSTKAAYAPY